MKTVIYNVFLAIVFSKTTEAALMKKPMGIKMCERECQCLKGCNAIRYDIVSLECTPLMDSKDEVKDSPSVITKTVPSSNDPSYLLLVCSEGERSVMNRQHRSVCVPSEESSVLLLVPSRDEITTAFKVNLFTKEIESLPFFWNHVSDLLPVPSEEKYLIATGPVVISSPMSIRQDTTILRRTVYLMRSDEKRRLVFLTWESFRCIGIGRMNTDGRKYRTLHCAQDDLAPITMDIDPAEQKVYFTTERGLIRINYDGNDQTVERLGHIAIMDFLYNPSKGELYSYNDRTGQLMRSTRRNNVPVPVVVKRFPTIRSAVLYSGVLYIAGYSKDEISSVRIDETYPPVVTYPLPKTALKDGWILYILPAGQR